jgi:hypothetical protein
MNQLAFFDIQKSKPDGQDLRDRGMKRALQHAEDVEDGWNIKALDFLYVYAKSHPGKFSGEMVRLEAEGTVPKPPCLRAWGGILANAARRGWIRQVGYTKVTNPDAHQANAALWESLIIK